MKPYPLAFALVLAAVVPAGATICTADRVKKAMEDESSRQSSLQACADAPSDDGGQNGVCLMNWAGLDRRAANEFPCMSREQLEQFVRWSNLYFIRCELIRMSGSKRAYASQCGANWNWLDPFVEAEAKKSAERWRRELETPAGALEAERSRVWHLKECAEHGPAGIREGGLDGVCAGNWSHVSPAEAKVLPRMSKEDLREFQELYGSYVVSCSLILQKIGDVPQFHSLCGADWSWLRGAMEKP